jgi:hypothetical protein
MKKNQEVTDYINKQSSPQKEICKKLRNIIFKIFPAIDEQMKLGVPWYGKYYIVSLKDSVNLGFSVKGLSKEEMDNFRGKGKIMRHLKFKELQEIDEARIVELLRLVDKKAECDDCVK